MKMYQHILPDYDVKLVGTEAEVLRYRRNVAAMREALEYYAADDKLGDVARRVLRTTSAPPEKP